MKQKTKGNLMMLLTALIWGTAFVAQSSANNMLSPFAFMAARYLLGAAVLIPVIFLFSKGDSNNKLLWLGGISCGCVLFVASALQQYGLTYTTTAKAGFITTLYVIFVPLAGLLFGKKPQWLVWIGVALSVVGFYFLSITDGLQLAIGDTLVLACALCFTAHIMVIDYFAPKVDGIKMSAIQFLTCGILSLIACLFTGGVAAGAVMKAWVPILYTGVLSSGVAYTLQIIAQKYTDAVFVSLIGSLEAVFAALAGWVCWKLNIIQNGAISPRQLVGCGLVLMAVMLVQIPIPAKGSKKQTFSS